MFLKELANNKKLTTTLRTCPECAGHDLSDCPHHFALVQLSTGYCDRWNARKEDCIRALIVSGTDWGVVDQLTGELMCSAVE